MGNSCHKTSLKIRNQRLPIQKTLQHNNRLFSKRETQPRITHRVIVCYKNKKTVNVEYRLLDLLENDLHSLDKSNKPIDFLLFF